MLLEISVIILAISGFGGLLGKAAAKPHVVIHMNTTKYS